MLKRFLSFFRDDDYIEPLPASTPVAMNDGEWHSVTFRRTGAVIDVFLDNVLVFTGTLNDTHLDVDTVNFIGAGQTVSYDFNGSIREFKIYNYSVPDVSTI